jgi:hypothetical protein
MSEATSQSDIVNDNSAPDTWSDIEISKYGLQPVTAYIRTQESKEAGRGRANRKKLEETGVRQLNVQAMVEAHPILKQIAKITRDGERDVLVYLQHALDDFSPQKGKQEKVTFEDLKGFRRDIYILGIRMSELTGWRRRVLNWLIIV